MKGERMFSVGDMVVYGGEGVCEVSEICTPHIPGIDKNKEYYKLRPLGRNGEVMTPVDTKVLMRFVMSHDDAVMLVKELPKIPPDNAREINMRALKDFYHETVMSYDCRRLAAMIKSTCRKRAWAIRHGKKVSQLDERYLKRAEDQFYGELGVALNIEKDSVIAYIRESYPLWPEGGDEEI